MARTTDPTSTRALHEHLGHDLIALVRALPDPVTYQVEIDLGKLVAGMIGAAVKAALPGRQSNKQVKAIQQVAQQAFARRLRRKAATLEPPA